MVATLRVVLDQVACPTEPDLALASRELTRALIGGARGLRGRGDRPRRPAGRVDEVARASGIARLHKVALARRELSAALQLGVATGIGGGMIHSPSLFAPLVKHDRVHDNDQTVVTVWDLRPWEAPASCPVRSPAGNGRCSSAPSKFADAIVVPTHSMASASRNSPPSATGCG